MKGPSAEAPAEHTFIMAGLHCIASEPEAAQLSCGLLKGDTNPMKARLMAAGMYRRFRAGRSWWPWWATG